MNVLSLFDGMSCGQLALNRAGVNYENYFASEIDKYAIKVTQANYPGTVQLGDVSDWREWDLPNIDLVLAGSPCQGFSFSGKQLAFEDPRSKLFFTFVEIVKHFKPRFHLLENVRMKKDYRDAITEICGVEPMDMNSALVSAQNRKRLYWFNWTPPAEIEDRGILLQDILLDGSNTVNQRPRGKNKGGDKEGKSPCMTGHSWQDNVKAIALREKANCLTTEPKSPNRGDLERFHNRNAGNFVIDPSRVEPVNCDKPGGVVGLYDGKNAQATRIRNTEGKAQTLTGGGGGLFTKMGAYPVVKSRGEYDANYFKGADNHGQRSLIKEAEGCYRKLHPVECERLQTVPDGYTDHVSNTQRYKMLGNGWTVDVIVELLKANKELVT